MDSSSPNSSQINPSPLPQSTFLYSSPLILPLDPDEMQIENLPSTLDTKETLTNQATTATPLRISTSSSGENGTVQEPIVIESLQNTPQQNPLVSKKKISKVFIIDDTPEQLQDSSIQIENPKSSATKDLPVRSSVFTDQPRASSIAADQDSSADEAESTKTSEKKSVNKLSFLNKYLSSTSKTPSPVIPEEKSAAVNPQAESTSDFTAAASADSNLKAISDLAPTKESAKKSSDNMEIIDAPAATENIVIEQKEIIEADAHAESTQNPAVEEETVMNQNTKEDQGYEEPSYNIMDRPPQHEDPYLADSNMLFGFRPQTSPCDPTTSPTKLARYNSLLSDTGKISAGYKFGGHGEDSRGIDVRGDLMAMMNAENSMPVDAGVVREEYEEHEEAEEKTSQKKEVKMKKVERVQTIINGNIAKESPKHSEPDLNNNKEIEAIVESIVAPGETQENDHSMAIENEAKYQPSLGEVVELDSQQVPTTENVAVDSPAKEQATSPKEGRSSMKKLKEVREEEVDEKITQEETANKFGETAEMSVEVLMDEERRKSEAEPLPLRHAKTPNYLERKLQKIQEDNMKSMGDFEFKKKHSRLEMEKMEAKKSEAYKPKAQPQKSQENSSTFMSDTKQHFSKLQLEKMASKAKEGTQSAMQKTQPRTTSKSPVPQRKVVTPNAIPSSKIVNNNKPNNANANAVSSLNRNTNSHLKRKFDALKPQNGQNVPQQTAGHEMKKVKLTTPDLNISAFSLAESVMVTKENMPGNMNMQNVQQSGILTKKDTSASRNSGNGMPKTTKCCVFCAKAFANKNDTKMMSCLHKAHNDCYIQMERRKKASCPLCNSNTSPISGMFAMPKPAAYKF